MQRVYIIIFDKIKFFRNIITTIYKSVSTSVANVENVTTKDKSGLVSASASALGYTANEAQLLSQKLSLELAIQLASNEVSSPDEKFIITDTHSESVISILPDPNPTDVITLYYRSKVKVNNEYVSNAGNTDNITNNNEFSGYSTRNAADINGVPDKNTIINYFGYRTPANVSFNVPAYFDETINIKQNKTDFISATSLYEDSGSSSVTSVPFNVFYVTSAAGIFEGYKFIKIFYDNTNFSRVVEITKNL